MLNNHQLRVLFCLCAMITLNLFVSGCWDNAEIENRGFVLGIAVDYAAAPESKEKSDLLHVTQEEAIRKYRVTFELPKFPKRGGAEQAGGTTEEHLIFAGEGQSLFAISRAISARIFWNLIYDDLQVIIINEAVAKAGIGGLMDFFTRYPGMRERSKVFITPGPAVGILKERLKVDEINSMHIAKLVRNVEKIPRFAETEDLNHIVRSMLEERSFMLPIILMENGDVKLTSGAVFNRRGEMVGELDEWEIVGAKIIRDKLHDGVFTVRGPVNSNKLVAVSIEESKSEVKSHLAEGKLRFTVDGKFICSIGENTDYEQKVLNPAYLAAIEQQLTDEFTRQTYAAYHGLQAMKADCVDLGLLVHREQPQYWKKVKDRWDDEIFPTVPLDVNIKVVIKQPGMTS